MYPTLNFLQKINNRWESTSANVRLLVGQAKRSARSLSHLHLMAHCFLGAKTAATSMEGSEVNQARWAPGFTETVGEHCKEGSDLLPTQVTGKQITVACTGGKLERGSSGR